jgi:Uma2 family endonuclease
MVANPEKIKQWTYDDLAVLPEYGSAPDADKRYEIIDGELVMTAAPLIDHQRIILNLASELRSFVNSQKLGHIFIAPADVVLSRFDVVQPDIFFIESDRSTIITEKNILGAPDLCVEVVSPFSDRRDRKSKYALYARYAVPSYWIVDPRLRVLEEYDLRGEQFRLVREWKADELFLPGAFPGLSIALAEIFPAT